MPPAARCRRQRRDGAGRRVAGASPVATFLVLGLLVAWVSRLYNFSRGRPGWPSRSCPSRRRGPARRRGARGPTLSSSRSRPGSYNLSFSKEGYSKHEQTVEIRAGESSGCRSTWKPSPDTGFELTSDPPGQLVWLDGQPFTGSDPERAPGAHRLQGLPGATGPPRAGDQGRPPLPALAATSSTRSPGACCRSAPRSSRSGRGRQPVRPTTTRRVPTRQASPRRRRRRPPTAPPPTPPPATPPPSTAQPRHRQHGRRRAAGGDRATRRPPPPTPARRPRRREPTPDARPPSPRRPAASRPAGQPTSQPVTAEADRDAAGRRATPARQLLGHHRLASPGPRSGSTGATPGS